MSPQTLLTRWRDRWDKPAAETMRLPYVYGKVKLWSDRFAHARAWSIPALCAALMALGLLLMVVLLTVRLSLHGQIVSSVALFGVALFVRRYGGLLATLLLLWLSLCVTGRYLLWRFGESLGSLTGLDYVRESESHLAIGALTRESSLEQHAFIPARYQLLADAAHVIADPLVRNRATVGGNLPTPTPPTTTPP